MSVRARVLAHPPSMAQWLVIILSLSLSPRLSGQTFDPGLFTPAFLRQFTVKHYHADNGLPQNEITALAIDQDHFVWFGTQAGLVRWDGAEFVTFTSRSSPLCYDRIFNIDRDLRSDRLLVRDEQTCIACIDQGRIHALPEVAKADTTYWIRDGCFPLRDRHSPGAPRIDTMYKILDSTLYPGPYNLVMLDSTRWLHTRANQVTLWKGAGVQRQIELPQSMDASVKFSYGDRYYLLGSDRIIYILDTLGQVKQDESLLDLVRPEPGMTFRYHSSTTRQRQPVISYGDQFFLLSVKEGRLEVSRLFAGLNTPLIGYVLPLSDDQFLITTRNEGFVVATRKIFATLYSSESQADQIIYAHVQAHDGSLLAHNNLVYDPDRQTAHPAPYEHNWWSTSLYKDSQGRLFASDFHHYYRIHDDFSTESLAFGPDRYWMFASDKDGRIWSFDMHSDSLGYFGADWSFRPVVPSPGIAWEQIKSMDFDGQGDIWMRTKHGVIVLDRTQNIYRALPALAGSDVRHFKFDGDSTVWISTYNNGFGRYHKGTFFHFPFDQSQYLINSHYILEDSLGYFWIPTNNGIFRFMRSELEDYAEGRSQKFFYQHFDKDDGLLTNEFNGGPNTGQVLADGRFSMASMKGIVLLDPYAVKQRASAGGFWVDARIDGEVQTVAKKFRVPSRHSDVTFHVSSPSLLQEEIYYRMAGLSSEWKILEDPVLKYFRLRGGHYSLQLRKYRGFGGGQELFQSIDFAVQPTFINRTWVRICGLLMIVLVGVLVHRLRLRYLTNLNLRLSKLVELRSRDLKNSNSRLTDKIEELNETQEKLSDLNRLHEHLLSMVSHDIRGSLNFISLLAGEVAKSDTRDVDTLKENFSVVKRSSDSMVQFVEQLLSYLKSSQGTDDIDRQLFSVRRLIDETIAVLEPRIKELQVHVEHLPGEINLRSQRPFFGSIVHNILENEIKHGNRNIEIKYQDNEALIIGGDQNINADRLNAFLRSDSFFYYDQQTNRASLGLAIMKNLSEKLGLTLEYESLKPNGHAVRINTVLQEGELVAGPA